MLTIISKYDIYHLAGRDWGYDWTLPNVNHDGDIPLGYAAADAYATPRHSRKPKQEEVQEESRSRGRNRLRHRIHQRTTGTQHHPEQNGYDSDQSPTRVQREEVKTAPPVQGHYGFYPQHPNTAQPAQQNGQPPQSQGMHIFCIISVSI